MNTQRPVSPLARYAGLLLTGFFLGVITFLVLTACGGGGSGSSPAGTVTLAMTDAPSDAFEALTVTVASVTLIGASGHVAIPLESPITVDLLDLDGINQLLATASVPVDTYNKIRLELSDAEVTWPDGTTEDVTIVANGKVDLNFQGGLTITDGSAVTIQLDFSAEESLKLEPTGSGKLILRPQIFVMTVGDPQDPENPVIDDAAGVVAEVDATDQTFVLRVRSGLTLTVAVTDETTIVSHDGPATFADLHTGLMVHVEGTLDADGRLVATVIHIVRERRAAYGLITQLDATAGTFVLLHRDETTTNVAFDADTTVLFLGHTLGTADLANGQLVRVGGDFDASDTLFASVIRIRPDRFAGVVTDSSACLTGTFAVRIGPERLISRLEKAGIVLEPEHTIVVEHQNSLECPDLSDGTVVRIWGRLVPHTPDVTDPNPVRFLAARIAFLPGHTLQGLVSSLTPNPIPGGSVVGTLVLQLGAEAEVFADGRGEHCAGAVTVVVTSSTTFEGGLSFETLLDQAVTVQGVFIRGDLLRIPRFLATHIAPTT